MTCFSRRDANKELFTGKIKKGPNKRRRNYNLLLDVKNGTLFCKNKNYTIDELCIYQDPDRDLPSQSCVLKTGEEVELNMFK